MDQNQSSDEEYETEEESEYEDESEEESEYEDESEEESEYEDESEEEEKLTPAERIQAMKEIADHERLSQLGRKLDVDKALVVAAASATTCGTIAATVGAAGGPLTSLAAGGEAFVACGTTGFVGSLASDLMTKGTVEGTMKPPAYPNRGNPYNQNISVVRTPRVFDVIDGESEDED